MEGVTNIEHSLRELLSTIDLHTDCMTNQIDREPLEPYIARAFIALGDLDAEPETITFFPSVSKPLERT